MKPRMQVADVAAARQVKEIPMTWQDTKVLGELEGTAKRLGLRLVCARCGTPTYGANDLGDRKLILRCTCLHRVFTQPLATVTNE